MKYSATFSSLACVKQRMQCLANASNSEFTRKGRTVRNHTGQGREVVGQGFRLIYLSYSSLASGTAEWEEAVAAWGFAVLSAELIFTKRSFLKNPPNRKHLLPVGSREASYSQRACSA
uniref:Uncharacterized protein n=1 Tax=Rhinopithecus bieti TaxID=61621 RepID=A0A2K6KP13_RHIBE